MKKLTLLAIAAACVNALFAQSSITIPPGGIVSQCIEFHKTIALRDMPLQTEAQKAAAIIHHREIEEKREAMRPKFPNFKKLESTEPDPVIQSTDGTMALSGPIVNFDGQVMNGGGYPPDPDGAVGPTQYVEAINSSYQVYNKTGTSLKGPVDLLSLFPGTSDDGDPIVLYDKFADRWFISEFEVSTTPVELLVAVSETGDATGSYYTYKFANGIWTSQNYPDYPKYSIWTDGYYETSQYSPEGVVWLDRARMIAGKSSARLLLKATPASPAYFGGNNSLYSSAKTLDCDASALPPYGTPEYLMFFQNVQSGGFSDMIYFDKLVTDTTGTPSMTISPDSVAPPSFNAYFSGGNMNEVVQPSGGGKLDVLDGTFNFRVPFMEFTGYNSMVLCNTVNVGSGSTLTAAIRWYELRQTGAGQPWTIYQSGTYAPSDGADRWNGSIGMDQDGDIALEYSVSSSSIYPSIRYTGRMSTDALGTMTGTETTVIAGTSPAISTPQQGGNRWGDYSEMTLDPSDNVTFWNANEYDGAGNQNSRVWSFQLTKPKGIANLIDLAQFKVYQVNDYLNVIANTLPSDDEVQVDLFDINGKQISNQTVKPAGNTIQTTVPVDGLAKGVYFVRIGNLNYQRVFKVEVN
ncbi:MAG: T9SS type A sorting domain-containing protein [Bacteroidia bacterium]